MGLNDNFDGARNQILMQEPLPNVNKTYAMLLTVESQRSVQRSFEQQLETTALMVETQKQQ